MSEGKDRLKQIRKALNLSQTEFANSVGLPCSMINSIEGGKQKLSVRVAFILKEKIVRKKDGTISLVTEDQPLTQDDSKLRMDWLVGGEGEPFEVNLKISNELCINAQDGMQYLLPFNKNIKFYTVDDDSMFPYFIEKDIVAVDSEITEISNGDVFLFRYDNQIMLRKIYKINKNEYNIVALNEKIIPPLTVNFNEVEIIGKVIYKIGIV